ncbi:MAG: hypothetical protein ACRD32_00780 [Nitrososphaerales archaeon]
MASKSDTCTISFSDEEEKAKAFYVLIHSRAPFSGIDKNTFVITKKDCNMLKSKHIKYDAVS